MEEFSSQTNRKFRFRTVEAVYCSGPVGSGESFSEKEDHEEATEALYTPD
jgi:hypothetical protein